MSKMREARKAMVDSQVRVNGVTDRRVHAAMLQTERELFIPKGQMPLAYSDVDLDLGDGRHLMKPRDFSKLLQALEIKPTDLVLDIGTGGGYAAAVMAQLAETVVALEDDADAVHAAEANIQAAGADNIVVVEGKLRAGFPDQAPFDVVFVGGAVEKVPDSWLQQLSDGGRLGVVERQGADGEAVIYSRNAGIVGRRAVFDAFTPYLPGFAPEPGFVF